jgi:hypothetical protein
MKLVQKILSHGLLIAFIVAAFFLYTNRTELFPRWFAESSVASADGRTGQDAPADGLPPATVVTRPLPEKTLVKEPLAAAEDAPVEAPVAAPEEQDGERDAAPAASGQGSGSSASADDSGQPVEDEHNWKLSGQDSDRQPSYRPLEEAAPQEQTAPDEAAAKAGSGEVETPPAQAPEETVETGVEPTEAVSEQQAQTDAGESDAAVTDDAVVAEPVDEPADSADTAAEQPQPVPEATTAGLMRQLEQARSLYWQGQAEAAASAYEALASEHADNAELWGEIGNFYYSVGRNEQATEAYSRAIELFVRDDERERARQLLGALYRLDAQKASELEMKMR